MNVKREMAFAAVSVVIPCYNAEKNIEYALTSVQQQTQPVFEVICVDDCSEDNTVQALEAFRSRHPDLRMQILKTAQNSGPGTTRNLGWDSAASDYIAFLDADDAWHSQKIAIQYAWMRTHPQIDLCGHSHVLSDLGNPADVVSAPIDTPKAYSITRDEILLANPFVTPSVMLKRGLPYRFGEKRRYTEDYLLWMQICLSGHPVAMLDSPLVSVSFGSGNEKLSRHYWRMRWGDIKNYWQLWTTKQISFPRMGVLVAFSVLKFILGFVFPDIHSAVKRRLFTRLLRENP